MPLLNLRRSPGTPESGAPGNLRQVRHPDQAILACEGEGLIAVLSLGDAENPVRSGVVDRYGPVIVDHQAAGIRKNGVPEAVLCADGARFAQPGRPPVH